MLGNHEPTLVLIVLIPPETGPNEKNDLHLLAHKHRGEPTWRGHMGARTSIYSTQKFPDLRRDKISKEIS